MAEPAPTPFRGLAPYREEDAMFFFGREQAQTIIRANLLAYPLTVLFGATGVGKSSVLHAGVAHHLKREAKANLDQGRLPELAVALISSWRHDPMVAIRQAVKTELERIYPQALKAGDPKDLGRALKVWAKRIGGPILVIVDQFEEYFLYRAEEKGRRSFA
jgi:hypothetical protein